MMEDVFILTKVIKFHFSILIISIICVPTASEAGCKVYQSTHVDCTYRDLTAVPSNLPSSTTHLDLSHNEITRLQPGCLENLLSLEELIMYIFEDLIIDVNAFKGLHNLRSLSFPGDGSVTFNKGTFRRLSHLQTLEIQIKTFVNIPDDLFSDLINLSKLTIRRPAIDVKYSRAVFLPPSLFRGLDNLEELAVVGSFGSSLVNFSSESFKDLVRLKIIHFDIDHLKCDDIEKLRLLKNVEVIRFSRITTGTFCSLTFSQFPRLKEVYFDDFNIDAPFPIFDWSKNCSHYLVVHVRWDNNGQEAQTFPRLSPYNTSHLSISSMFMDGQPLECYLNGLRSVAINSLKMVPSQGEVHNFTETTFESLASSDIQEMDIWFTLDKIATNTFQGLTQLKVLNMNDCDLRDGAFVSLNASPTLTTFSLASNKFRNFKQFLSAIAQLNNLRNIDVSGNIFTGKIPKNAFWKHRSLTSINLSRNEFNLIDPESFSFLSHLQHLDLSNNKLEMVPRGAFHSLKSLNTLLLVGNSLTYQGGTEIYKHPLKNLYNITMLTLSILKLETIDLADTPRLENLHIDETSWVQLYGALFPENILLEHLTVLIVKNAKFVSLYRGRVIINTEVIYLQPRQFLRVLELANNNFNELNFTSLNEFRSLVDLSVTNNKLTIIHGVPDKLDKLESLDLSGNLVAVLSSEILTNLPSLNVLIIFENPFDCSCKMKPFKNWLKKDEKAFVDFSDLIIRHSTCSLPRVKYGIPINLVELGFECDLVLLIALLLTCFIIMVIVIIALVKRFHWHMRYAYFHIKLRLGGYQLQINDEEQPINKRYDAFVVYNQHDSDWVIHELIPYLENIDPPNFKLCIHERDFLPGNDIFENILDSIEQSKKTLLILSPDFAASEWCYFEMRMAQSCLFEEKRDIIVMVSLKKIPDNDMPRILRNILLAKSFMEWPENEMGRRLLSMSISNVILLNDVLFHCVSQNDLLYASQNITPCTLFVYIYFLYSFPLFT